METNRYCSVCGKIICVINTFSENISFDICDDCLKKKPEIDIKKEENINEE